MERSRDLPGAMRAWLVLVLCVLSAALLVTCTQAQQSEEATQSSVSTDTESAQSPTPEPTVERDALCADVEGQCIAARLIGDKCTLNGIKRLHKGLAWLIYEGDKEVSSRVELYRVRDDNTIEDLLAAVEANPYAPPAVTLATALELGQRRVELGETVRFNEYLLPGDYAFFCVPGDVKLVLGGVFAVEN